jgi:hypothetical protein
LRIRVRLPTDTITDSPIHERDCVDAVPEELRALRVVTLYVRVDRGVQLVLMCTALA